MTQLDSMPQTPGHASPTPPIRVLCVDDHAFVLEGLAARLSVVPDMEFVGRLSTADDLVAEARRTRADVVLVDIEMPGTDPFDALDDLRRQVPGARALILSAYVRDHYIDAAVSSGAWGYVTKNQDPEVIIDSIRRVARGEFVFGPGILERCNVSRRSSVEDDVKPASKLHSLTPREQQILRMIGRGMSRAEIAKAIHRSPKTVDAHRASIMQKMNMHDRVELARYAIREGLVEA